jgi:hypothetical protein
VGERLEGLFQSVVSCVAGANEDRDAAATTISGMKAVFEREKAHQH